MRCLNDCPEGSIISSFEPTGVVHQCTSCGAIVKPQTEPEQASPAPAPAPRQPVKAPQMEQRPRTVKQQLRARIAELKREIQRLEKLRREHDELVRILKAARQKSTDSGAVVRPLRKQA